MITFSLAINLIIPVHWLETSRKLPSQGSNPRIYQQNLEYQLEATLERKLGIFKSIDQFQEENLLQDGVKHGGKTRISRLNPAFGEPLPYTLHHTKSIYTIAFSPDGSLLASGGEDNIIKLWDVTLGIEILTFYGHVSPVRVVTFSPDGTVLASASNDGSIKLWSTTSGKILQNLTHNEILFSLVFSHDSMLLALGDLAGYIKIWNTTEWEEEPETFKAHDFLLNYMDFSPDGKLMATCGAPKTIKIWNTSNWENISPLTEHSDIVNEVKFSPDGKMLVSACIDSKFWLWDVEGRNIIYKYNEHEDIIGGGIIGGPYYASVDFSPIGSLLASGGEDSLIRLWDPARNTTIQILSGHEDSVSRVIFSPDGTVLASSSKDKTIKIWNIAQGAKKGVLTGHEAAITSVVYSPNGELLASGSEDTSIKLWDLSNGDMKTLKGHTKTVTSVVFSPDSSLLASASWDSNIMIWNTTNYQVEFEITNHTGHVQSLTFSSDGTMLASGGANALSVPEVRIWNVTSGKQLQERLGGHNSPVTSVAFSPDDTFLVSGSEDGSITIWNTTTWTWKQIIDWHEVGGVNSIMFSPDGTVLATSGDDTTIKIMNATNRKSIYNITGHSSYVLSICFSPDGQLLASGSVDGTIRTWNMSDGKEVQIYFHKFSVNSVIFSLDGRTIASGGSDSTIVLWVVGKISDSDEDGMPDEWELQFSPELNPSDYWDKFHDEDNDGLMNSLEHFLGTYPNDTDSDNDNIPDGWEYLGGLNPITQDTNNDNDNDGLPAIYEYQMGLNPWVNDAALDNDNDTLTNLQEYKYGSWANDTDTDDDGMRDDWEFNYKFYANNSADANDDPDGDWVSNLDEFRGGSNPRDFWSVPLLAPSAYFFIRVVIFLIVFALIAALYLKYRTKQRQIFTASLNAPDYATALKVQKAGYTDLRSFVQAISDAKTLAEEGMNSFYQGNPVKAIQQLEQSLTVFERVRNEALIARTIFQVAQIQKERRELTVDSSILKIFPKTPFAAVEAIDHMLQALLAEAERNWGLSNVAWQAALKYEELDSDLRIICQGALVESEVRSWLENPIDSKRALLVEHLDKWQEECQQHHLYPSLCQADLLRARISFASVQFDDVEKRIEHCLEIAETKKLSIYQEAARREKVILLRHKNQIEKEMAKPISPEEQEKVMQEYIKAAVELLQKERLI